METAMTKKLAITGVDFNSVTLACIFRVFESVVGDRVVRTRLYFTDRGESYSVIEFKDASSAKEAYAFCDGMEVEQTGSIFNLSFVPEDAELDSLAEECDSSRDFVHGRSANKRVEINEDMVQLSDDEILLDIEIPEEYKTKIQEKDSKAPRRTDATRKDDGTVSMKEAFGGDEYVDELEGFQFNVRDERFADLFEDDDFTLDASNKGFRLQRVSKEIFDEKLRSSGRG